MLDIHSVKSFFTGVFIGAVVVYGFFDGDVLLDDLNFWNWMWGNIQILAINMVFGVRFPGKCRVYPLCLGEAAAAVFLGLYLLEGLMLYCAILNVLSAAVLTNIFYLVFQKFGQSDS